MTNTPDFRELCADLVDKLDELNCDFIIPSQSALIKRANDALTAPPPAPPTDEELHQLWLDEYAFHGDDGPTSGDVAEIARAVLERWGNH
jgi:hypothetical protein